MRLSIILRIYLVCIFAFSLRTAVGRYQIDLGRGGIFRSLADRLRQNRGFVYHIENRNRKLAVLGFGYHLGSHKHNRKITALA
jgi:hypothetical protein